MNLSVNGAWKALMRIEKEKMEEKNFSERFKIQLIKRNLVKFSANHLNMQKVMRYFEEDLLSKTSKTGSSVYKDFMKELSTVENMMKTYHVPRCFLEESPTS